MAYSGRDDLLTGDIPVPQMLDPVRYVNDASDEIDSIIGFRYATPVDLLVVDRPVALLLKRLGNFIASGRLMMAAAAGGQDKQLNAYAKSLLEQAHTVLAQIASGELVLPGAAPTTETGPPSSAPLIANKDTESQVDAFYDRIVAPGTDGSMVYPYTWPKAVPW